MPCISETMIPTLGKILPGHFIGDGF